MRSLLSRAKRQNKADSDFKKRALHLLFDDVTENGLNNSTRDKAKTFFRGYEFDKLDDEGIIKGLETRLTGSYTNVGVVDGLILLGFARSEAEASIKEYRSKVIAKCVDLKVNYSDDLAIIQRKRIAYYTTPENTSEAVYSTVARESINEEAKAVNGFQLYIKDELFIYTKSFSSFLLGNYDFLSKTIVSRIEAILKRLQKNDAIEANTILSLILGKRKSSELTGTKKVENVRNCTFSSIDSNRQNSAEYHLLDFDFIKTLGVNTNIRAKLNKELKKFLYQKHISMINKYYTNDDLNEAINFDYLRKYKVMVDPVEKALIEINIYNDKIQEMLDKNELDEYNGAEPTFSDEELKLNNI